MSSDHRDIPRPAGALVIDPDELVIEVRSGPAVVEPLVLGPGHHLVGRAAHCSVSIPDPAIEPHHLAVEVDTDGSIRLRQLTGRLAIRVDGVAVREWSARAVPTHEGVDIELGASRLCIRRRPVRFDPATPRITMGGRTAVLRRPRPGSPSAVSSTIATSTSRSSDSRRLAGLPPGSGATEPADDTGIAPTATAGIIGALGGAVSAAVIAAVTRQLLFVLIAATAVGISVLTTLFESVRRHRRRIRRRRERDTARTEATTALTAEIDRHRRELIERYLERVPPLGALLESRHGAALWARRSAHDDALVVSLGEGSVELTFADSLVEAAADMPELLWRAARAEGLSIPLDLRAHRIVAVAGAFAAPVVRSIVIQAVITSGPADLTLAVVTDRPEHHDWCRPLPHLREMFAGHELAARPSLLDTPDIAPTGPHLVVITDDVDAMLDAGSSLRRAIAGSARTTVIVEVAEAGVIPAVADGVLYTGLAAAGRWCPEGADARPQRLRIAGLDRSTAMRIAAEFTDLVDPETGTAALVARIGLGEIEPLPPTVDAVIDRWTRGSRQPRARIGVGIDGRPVSIDLIGDGPHALVAGTTGSGKSELLRTMVVAMALESSPADLNFVLIDYKGGATFDRLRALAHIVGVITDLDEHLAERAMVSLGAELRRREQLLRAVGAVDLDDHRRITAGSPGPALARLVVIVDEFAALVTDVPGFVPALVALAQRGRSLGIHLVLATQRPAGVIDDHIRANTDLRIALRLNDVADALDVVGSSEPAHFARSTPGRTMISCGGGTNRIVQTAYCAEGLDALVELLAAAGRVPGSGGPHGVIAVPYRPWLAPLGELDGSALTTVEIPRAIGLIDDPEHQRREPLCWNATDHLALVGARRSGVGEALVELVVAEARGLEAGGRLALVDAGASGFRRLSGRAVSVDDRERLRRLMAHLVGLIEERRADADAARPRVVLAVDGWLALRRALEADDEATRDLDRLLVDGPVVDLCIVAAVEVDGARTAAALGRFANRWIFHLDDPADAPLFGIASAEIARRGELTIFGCGRRARVLVSGSTSIPDELVESVAVLPANDVIVPRGSVGTPSSTGVIELSIGRWYEDLAPAVVEVAEGDHLVVLGPPRSGRTTALRTISAVWSAGRPGGTVIEIDGRRSRIDELIATIRAIPGDAGQPTGPPLLLVIDDMERLDDPSGRLATWLETAVPGRLVVAAGRPDAMRAAYGHWSTVLRRSRCGIVMSATAEADADLLGIAPPRRCPLVPRPGLGWTIGSGPTRLLQIGRVDPAGSTQEVERDAFVHLGGQPQ